MGTSFGRFVKRFYGGDINGVCFQITNQFKENGEDLFRTRYVLFRMDDIGQLIKELQKCKDDEML